ncbi:hypothetical protein CLUG_05097 [Clavispora lusitaniae ATCC 42720]|uniref:Uncharacterized protein n=1 Tax=Clavispora lusitaniae (strain ATCC 42720) TaxID=306902 RepID=C4YAF9_CLAL4|nr:uncharacterized protein CLUG_05097 [Clavispora lusitaniae ATCC 42720]EEQ40969.1 hypothetical protein CLUG_05097 [Clavispora lusitaniae ATCC 42720]
MYLLAIFKRYTFWPSSEDIAPRSPNQILTGLIILCIIILGLCSDRFAIPKRTLALYANLFSLLERTSDFFCSTSSLDALYVTFVSWFMGFSGDFWNSLNTMFLICCNLNPGFSFSISGVLLSSNAANAAFTLLSGCSSISLLATPPSRPVNAKASKASSIPEALNSPLFRSQSKKSSILPVLLAATLAAPLCFSFRGLAGMAASSAAKRASLSAFFLAASSFLNFSSSFFLLPFLDPSSQAAASSASAALAAACFFLLAASAFSALPAAFFEFSPPFLAMFYRWWYAIFSSMILLGGGCARDFFDLGEGSSNRRKNTIP